MAKVSTRIKSNGCKESTVLEIDGIRYIGTKVFLLREDLAPDNYCLMLEKLGKIKILDGGILRKYSLERDYVDWRIEADTVHKGLSKNLALFNTSLGEIALDELYYSYFKRLLKGVAFYFRNFNEPIGLFKDKEFLGLILPIKT